jgi:hypothetical protein
MFEQYKHATAMHHFKTVCQVLKNHNKLGTIFRNNQKTDPKGTNDLDMELLTA